MEKKLIYFNEKNYKLEVTDVNYVMDRCQGVIDKFISLNIGAFENADFKKLLFSTDKYLEEKTMGEKPLELGGLEISKEEFYKIFKKPAGYAELVTLANKFSQILNRRKETEESDTKEYISYFEFYEVGKLQLKENILEDLKERNKLYALKERTILTFELAEKISKLINESDIFNRVSKISSNHQFYDFFDHILTIDMITQKVDINIVGIKTHDNK